MKKIIIVNNNMKVGGVQKSLYNLLWTMEKRYDITLYLFQSVGAYLDQLPPGIRIVHCSSLFCYLGISQEECKTLRDKLTRGALAAACRLLGRTRVMKLLLASQRVLEEHYDCAVSFLHDGNHRSFYGGVQDFVLHRVSADRKIAFLHGDYRNCGANYEENNRSMAEFDKIAACSDGCRRAFAQVLPELAHKCETVRNCHRYEEIRALAEEDPVSYDGSRIHVICVGRLAHEKGIQRAVEAVAAAIRNGTPVTLHLVGSGGMENELHTLASQLGVAEYICFHGEQSNPYRYMKHADLLLLTSFHEAAPMVIEEASCLGLPVLTVCNTSSEEMVTNTGCGWVCGNTQEDISTTLADILNNTDALARKKLQMRRNIVDNTQAIDQFIKLIEESDGT